jgi:hypothetical protein
MPVYPAVRAAPLLRHRRQSESRKEHGRKYHTTKK